MCISKINNGFTVNGFANKKTSRINLKMQRHDVNVSGKFTCVYSDRQNSISDEQQLMLHWAG